MKSRLTRVFTVWPVIVSRWAMSGFDRPCAISTGTSTSRAVSSPTVRTGRHHPHGVQEFGERRVLEQEAAAFERYGRCRLGAGAALAASRAGSRTASRSAAIARRHGCDRVWFGAAAPLGLMAQRLRHEAGARTAVATTHGHEVWWARGYCCCGPGRGPTR